MSLPQKPVRRGSRLGTAIAISVVAHVLLLPFVAQDSTFAAPVHRDRVTIVSKSQFQDLLRQRAQAQANSPQPFDSTGKPAVPNRVKPPDEKKTEEEKKAEELKLKGQLVSLPKPEDGRAPLKDTKYLAEFDSRVEKETRARDQSAANLNALNKTVKEGRKDTTGEGAPAVSERPGEEGQGGGKVELRKRQALQLPGRDRDAALHAKEAASGTLRNREASEEMKGKGQRLAMAQPGRDAQSSTLGVGDPGAKPGLPGNLAPLKLKLDQPIGATGPVVGGAMGDELRDVEEGEGTFLNARAFKFASYLNRIKETVGRVWVQKVQEAEMQRDPTGRIYGFKDRRTVVEYVLDKDGEVKDIRVEASSGVAYLDEVAVEAFRQVERFPNPPAGLIQADGLVKMNFSFLLIGGESGIRMQMGPAYVPGSAASRGF